MLCDARCLQNFRELTNYYYASGVVGPYFPLKGIKMAIDTYKNMMGGLESPAREAVVVTPDDVNDLVNTSRSIYVGTTGDVVVHMIGKTVPVVFKAVPAGILPIRADRVLATGTTAQDIVALW